MRFNKYSTNIVANIGDVAVFARNEFAKIFKKKLLINIFENLTLKVK